MSGYPEPSSLGDLEEIEAELVGVEIALRRLDDGSYGSCEVCRVSIDDLVAADPVARRCGLHPVSAAD